MNTRALRRLVPFLLFLVLGLVGSHSLHLPGLGQAESTNRSARIDEDPSAPCQLRSHGVLPDRHCSPGVADPRVTQANIHQTICVPGYTQKVRNVPQSEKDAVYRAYGIRHRHQREYEIDHIISLELGGSNAQANLYPESYEIAQGAHQKDRVENALHRAVCSGQVTLRRAQQIISSDWRHGLRYVR